MTITREELAAAIDHTQLNPNAQYSDIQKLCVEALQYHFGTICVAGAWVRTAKEILEALGAKSKVACVVGFPHGNASTDSKQSETRWAFHDGADEIDMVMNRGRKDGRSYVFDDINAVVKAANGKPVKVILETCDLTDEEIIRFCGIAVEAGAAFVKTSTGFGKEGATVAHVALMRKTVGPEVGVKAAGKIGSLQTLLAMRAAGANRFGTSKSVAIMEEFAQGFSLAEPAMPANY